LLQSVGEVLQNLLIKIGKCAWVGIMTQAGFRTRSRKFKRLDLEIHVEIVFNLLEQRRLGYSPNKEV
jgi:hypothetical protein